MNSLQSDTGTQALPQAGNPLLSQIHEFIDGEDTDQPALDPLGIVVRAVRGREPQLVAAALVVAVLCGLIAWLVVQPVFQSLGMIRVLPREAKILYVDSDDSRLRLFDAFVTAEMQFIQSRPVLDHALYLLNQKREKVATLPDDVGDIVSMLKVTNKKGLVSIAARSGDPQVASAVVNSVLEAYQDHNDESRQQLYNVRERELSQREDELSQTLVALNGEYLGIGGEHDAGTLAKAHTAKTTQLEVIEERIAELDGMISGLRTTGGAGADVGNVEIQRATLLDNALADMIYERAQRLAVMETLRMRYQSVHPELQAAEAELKVLETAIGERRDQIATLGKAGALTVGGGDSNSESIADLEVVRNRLIGRRKAVQEEATEFNSRLVRIRMVAAEQKRVAELLEETKRALDEVRVESQNDLSRSIQIVARGGVAERPIENKAKPAAIGGAVFGSLATLSALILLTVVQGRLRFSDDLDRRKQNVLSAVVAADDAGSLDSAAWQVRNELDLSSTGRDDRSVVVGVASGTSGSGCSSFALALAEAYLSAGRTVLLLEADETGQSLTERMGGIDEFGLLDVARGSVSLAEGLRRVRTGNSELAFLPMGSADPAVVQMMRSELTLEEFRSVLAEAASAHQVVVMDLGMLRSGRQSAIGAALSDQIVLVTAAGQPGRAVSSSCELLDRLAPNRYRLVFNRASRLDPELQAEEPVAKVTKQHLLSRWLGPRQEQR